MFDDEMFGCSEVCGGIFLPAAEDRSKVQEHFPVVPITGTTLCLTMFAMEITEITILE